MECGSHAVNPHLRKSFRTHIEPVTRRARQWIIAKCMHPGSTSSALHIVMFRSSRFPIAVHHLQTRR
jgi:hypothetical protein